MEGYITIGPKVGAFHEFINQGTYARIAMFDLHDRHKVIVAQNKQEPEQIVAMRLRVGRVGYAQWLNEVRVYALPDFKHKNIAALLGYDKRYATNEGDVFNSKSILDMAEELERPYESDEFQSEPEADSGDNGGGAQTRDRRFKPSMFYGQPRMGSMLTTRVPIDYWILNDYSKTMPLRAYIEDHTLTWAQLISIARGIADGLHYLHEHYAYQDIDLNNDLGAECLKSESDGKLKFFLYPGNRGTLRIQPPNLMTIVHRSLSSMNIVLRDEITPCIWNFGTAHVYHPYQPFNYLTIMDTPNQVLIMNSVYTPPEILRTDSVHTPRALRAADLYALGFIYWEMLSRCRLPPIEDGLIYDNRRRANPGPYALPLLRELQTNAPSCEMLHKHVCMKQVRPRFRPSWLRGKRSSRFIDTIKDLWDHDHDARIQISTVVERLAIMNTRGDKDYPTYVPDSANYEPDSPTAEEQVHLQDLASMPVSDDERHEARPRMLDANEPHEGVRYVQPDIAALAGISRPESRQQHPEFIRQVEMRRELRGQQEHRQQQQPQQQLQPRQQQQQQPQLQPRQHQQSWQRQQQPWQQQQLWQQQQPLQQPRQLQLPQQLQQPRQPWQQQQTQLQQHPRQPWQQQQPQQQQHPRQPWQQQQPQQQRQPQQPQQQQQPRHPPRPATRHRETRRARAAPKRRRLDRSASRTHQTTGEYRPIEADSSSTSSD